MVSCCHLQVGAFLQIDLRYNILRNIYFSSIQEIYKLYEEKPYISTGRMGEDCKVLSTSQTEENLFFQAAKHLRRDIQKIWCQAELQGSDESEKHTW